MEAEQAKEAGTYVGPDGIPVHIALGDPLPVGFVPENKFDGPLANEPGFGDSEEAKAETEAKGKARKPGANKVKDAPAESK